MASKLGVEMLLIFDIYVQYHIYGDRQIVVLTIYCIGTGLIKVYSVRIVLVCLCLAVLGILYFPLHVPNMDNKFRSRICYPTFCIAFCIAYLK